MAPDKSGAEYAHADGSGQPSAGATPLKKQQPPQGGQTDEGNSDRRMTQGKTADTGQNETARSRAGQQAPEEYRWLERLGNLEAQPVNDTEPPQSQQTPHMRLSQSQLENMDTFDIMDAMERGEW